MEELRKFEETVLTKYRNTLEYCGGYKTLGSRINMRCNECGSTFSVVAREVLKDGYKGCLRCFGKAKEKELQEQRIALAEQRRKRIETRVRQREEKREHKVVNTTSECVECGAEYVKSKSSSLCCSKSCSNKRSNRLRELRRREAIKNNGEVDYSISITRLISERGNQCRLCSGEVDPSDYRIDEYGNYIAGPMYPSIDHIKPVSLGGTHTLDNVQLAHHRCNTLKRDKVIYAEKNQMTMAI